MVPAFQVGQCDQVPRVAGPAIAHPWPQIRSRQDPVGGQFERGHHRVGVRPGRVADRSHVVGPDDLEADVGVV